ncbi:hypothetical protein VTJ83DRAFT_6479 [Remersonia thermophila]|uniref:Glucan 1, 4-alpha-glucosidase n=1 Tax=Remersonia thermophila TaxID=72144 RepID=A0ABR4D731_9PEZI
MASCPPSPPKRPRLSLQIKALANGPSVRTSRCLAAAGVDVTSPTSFNTLSNVYATAVDRSTPVQEHPPAAAAAALGRRPVLKLQTQGVGAAAARNANPASAGPYLGPYLDTPVTAQPISPAAVALPVCFPSAMTATPPLSAQAHEQSHAQVFTFDGTAPSAQVAQQQEQKQQQASNPKRRTTTPASSHAKLPYTHPRSLRSILRNSPLPSTKSPESPRRQSLRLQEKAARRVAYHSPLTQEITTTKYVRSHIDLLAEDSSATNTPVSPASVSSDDCDSLSDQAMPDAPETRDGGQTPGPFEEMRRRMANMHASTPTALSPTSGGIRKRGGGGGKRREKKRRWVWTIGQDDEGESCHADVPNPPTAVIAGTALPAPSVPILSVPSPRPRTRLQQAMARAVAQATQAQPAPAAPQAQPPPLLSVPVPPARRPQAQPPPAQPCDEPRQGGESRAQQPDGVDARSDARPLSAQPEQQEPTRPSQLQPPRDAAPLPDMAVTTPTTTGAAAEPAPPPPHTPSMASTTSTVSSVHSIDGDTDHGEDADMSDACSLTSVEDAEAPAPKAGRWYGPSAALGGLGLSLDVVGVVGLGMEAGHRRPYDDPLGEADGADGADAMDEDTPTLTARPIGGGMQRGWAAPWREGVSS